MKIKLPPVPKPITTLWDEHLAYIIEKPQGENLKWHKAVFYSAIIAYMEYTKKAFPDIKGTPSLFEKKFYTAQLQKIYDDANKELESLVNG